MPFLAFTQQNSKNENLSNALEYLENGELDSAKKYIDLASLENGSENNLKAFYYKGYIYKELYKKKENLNSESPSRIAAIEDLIRVLTFKDTTYHESSRKILKYLAATLFNDMVRTLNGNTVRKSISRFEKFKFLMHKVDSNYKNEKGQIQFNLACASALSIRGDINANINNYNLALGLYDETLALDNDNPSAMYNRAVLLGDYTSELLRAEKRILKKEEEKKEAEIELLNQEKKLLEKEREINEHELNKEKLEIEKNQFKIKTQKEKIKQEESARVFFYLGIGLLILFAGFMVYRYRLSQQQNLIIEKQRDEVKEAHREIRDSINYAERIQRSFLATDELLDNNLKDYFVFFQPKDVVSGDFYWAGKLADNNFAVVNADSTGHGVPGAIMSILNISSIEKAIENGHLKPSGIANHTRETIIERLSKDGSEGGGKDGMDASIISFDFKNNKFSYTAAQNPIWIIRDEELIEIKGEKMPIGKHDNDANPFVGGEFETQKGDVVYTLTDGFQDQFGGEKGKKFKVRPFKNLLISIAHLPMRDQKEILNEKFTTWKGQEEQVDDVCVIGVRV
jgi:serine phosphatase RsbU (regulator of sigma subunit)